MSRRARQSLRYDDTIEECCQIAVSQPAYNKGEQHQPQASAIDSDLMEVSEAHGQAPVFDDFQRVSPPVLQPDFDMHADGRRPKQVRKQPVLKGHTPGTIGFYIERNAKGSGTPPQRLLELKEQLEECSDEPGPSVEGTVATRSKTSTLSKIIERMPDTLASPSEGPSSEINGSTQLNPLLDPAALDQSIGSDRSQAQKKKATGQHDDRNDGTEQNHVDPFPLEQMHKRVIILMKLIEGEPDFLRPVSAMVGDVNTEVGRQVFYIAQFYETHLAKGRDAFSPRQELFENEWSTATWLVILVLSRIDVGSRHYDKKLVERHNNILITLANIARNVDPIPQGDRATWDAFMALYDAMTACITELYANLDKYDTPTLDREVHVLGTNYVTPCLRAFRHVCIERHKDLLNKLRRAESDTIMGLQSDAPGANYQMLRYHKVLMCVTCAIVARLQGFRHEYCKKTEATVDPVKPLIDSVLRQHQRLTVDALNSCRPHDSPIYVTNNLYALTVSCFTYATAFKSFCVQIVCEDTAPLIQEELRRIKYSEGYMAETDLKLFPSAALLAQKPQHALKRNNAKVSADGSNTGHKKSDVSSKESLPVEPSYDKYTSSWKGHYPSILCTTRRNDDKQVCRTISLDRRGQLARRPVFYFYIRATYYSPLEDCRNGKCYMASLSTPFVIATRKNQDHMRQGSTYYTGTIYWLCTTGSIDGLVLQWKNDPMPWPRFKQLIRDYIRRYSNEPDNSNNKAQLRIKIKRQFTDDDIEILHEKMHCSDCFGPEDHPEEITYKQMMCPHLRYKFVASKGDHLTENEQLDPSLVKDVECSDRYGPWRAIIETKMFFIDQRNCVAELWEAGLLMGFCLVDKIERLMSTINEPAIALYFSYFFTTCIAISVRRLDGSIVHIEPLGQKLLGAKSLKEFIFVLAHRFQINFIVNCTGQIVPLETIDFRDDPSRNFRRLLSFSSNITHQGDVNTMSNVEFLGVRIGIIMGDEHNDERKTDNTIARCSSCRLALTSGEMATAQAKSIQSQAEEVELMGNTPINSPRKRPRPSTPNEPKAGAVGPSLTTGSANMTLFEAELLALMTKHGRTTQHLRLLLGQGPRPEDDDDEPRPEEDEVEEGEEGPSGHAQPLPAQPFENVNQFNNGYHPASYNQPYAEPSTSNFAVPNGSIRQPSNGMDAIPFSPYRQGPFGAMAMDDNFSSLAEKFLSAQDLDLHFRGLQNYINDEDNDAWLNGESDNAF